MVYCTDSAYYNNSLVDQNFKLDFHKIYVVRIIKKGHGKSTIDGELYVNNFRIIETCTRLYIEVFSMYFCL